MSQTQIAQLLRQHRKEASLTQKELAQMLQCHNSAVSRVEKAHQVPKPEYLKNLIHVLHLSEAQQREIWVLYQQATGKSGRCAIAPHAAPL